MRQIVDAVYLADGSPLIVADHQRLRKLDEGCRVEALRGYAYVVVVFGPDGCRGWGDITDLTGCESVKAWLQTQRVKP